MRVYHNTAGAIDRHTIAIIVKYTLSASAPQHTEQSTVTQLMKSAPASIARNIVGIYLAKYDPSDLHLAQFTSEGTPSHTTMGNMCR